MSSNEPVKNGCEVIYEMFHILNCGFELNQVRDDHRSCVCNLNCNNASNVTQLQPSKLRMSSACSGHNNHLGDFMYCQLPFLFFFFFF